jgi:predicted ATPase
MLTRLKVSGFKNLVDADVRFGPFTCIAGANGVGKSNLFDAIHFLSLLADHTLLDAALHVRDETGRSSDLRNLFHRVGDNYDQEMSFEAEMLIPRQGEDDLGQPATASITFLKYALVIGYRKDATEGSMPLEIVKEELDLIKKGDARKSLLFPHKPVWRNSAVTGRRVVPFISTESGQVKLHQDGGGGGKGGGRPQSRQANRLPRTTLSLVNAAESPTATLARQEIRSWKMLQLEPSSLRRPDSFRAAPRVQSDGSGLAATLYHLSNQPNNKAAPNPDPDRIYSEIANRLNQLITDVAAVSVDKDEKRELYTLMVTDRSGTKHPAMSLSDGTLRFLALTVIEKDPLTTGVICLEEPENGIHPERVPAMLRLLQDIATDTDIAVGPDNPLRQVIVNTHSPAVVGEVANDSLICAELREIVHNSRHFQTAQFGCLSDTWRAKPDAGGHIMPKGKLLAYLSPWSPASTTNRNRVIDRFVQPGLFPVDGEE